MMDTLIEISRVIGEDDYGKPQREIIQVLGDIQNIQNKDSLTYSLTIFSKSEIKDKDEVVYQGKEYRINNVIDRPNGNLAYWKGVLNG